ncbi:SH3 domain-containing protein [Bacillus massiliigorillae]|uniref:SH3 domain-containing protein n=1 Tax=Bacillus massiliigorillae TaxID=1243664 RepID=UPI0003AA8EB1|nr:SH3 domain-containing protein [Bacillus massiliigorillae]
MAKSLLDRGRMIALLLVAIMIIPIVSIQKTEAATLKEATVDVPTATVKSAPNNNAKTVGTIKKSQKVKVYAQTQSGWAEIRFNKKKAYLSNKSIRFYKTTSIASVKKITDRVIAIQEEVKDQSYTLKQLHAIMDPAFTKTYFNQYVKSNLRVVGKDKKGTPIYGPNESDSTDFYVEPFDWYLKYAKEMPIFSYYEKAGVEYLTVSQCNPVNELYLPHWHHVYLMKEPKGEWKVYNVGTNLKK